MMRRYDLAMTEPGADQLSEDVERIVAGYTFDEPAIDLGVLMESDTPVPAAVVRIPLSMLNRHRQDQDAASDGRADLRCRRAGLCGRHQGRPVGHRLPGSAERQVVGAHPK